MKTQEENFQGFRANGIWMLIVSSLLLLGSVCGFIWSVNAVCIWGAITSAILFLISLALFFGFVLIEPNEASVMLFFGKYEGTIKDNGFFWVNPFYSKNKLTLRARNLDAEPIKVNDKTGNPVMIGMVLVWKVADTYKASFDIDNKSMSTASSAQIPKQIMNEKMKSYENFVRIQGEAVLRSVAGQYAYDHTSTCEPNSVTLRSGGEEINILLENQLNERLSIAGIEIIEARIKYLAYAPEVAVVMLRRQQADAIIAAREKIVDGAVGMVKMALDKLSDQQIVELDEDKKAAMVSNLMVVLCSDESAQPVLNAGSLYN